jgi:hypothetical protein
MDELRLREDAIEWREVEGEIVALDLESSEYIAVNRTGAAIWPLLAEGARRDALAARLVVEYGIDEDSAARDVDAFVKTLSERDLLAEE